MNIHMLRNVLSYMTITEAFDLVERADREMGITIKGSEGSEVDRIRATIVQQLRAFCRGELK